MNKTFFFQKTNVERFIKLAAENKLLLVFLLWKLELIDAFCATKRTVNRMILNLCTRLAHTLKAHITKNLKESNQNQNN